MRIADKPINYSKTNPNSGLLQSIAHSTEIYTFSKIWYSYGYMEESEVKETKAIRDESGLFLPGHNAPGPGRPPDTEEKKIAKKAAKEIIKEYKERLAEALPKIESVLIEKAIAGDISFIKELHDRAMGKPEQKSDVTSGGKPIPILGNAILINDGNKENSES